MKVKSYKFKLGIVALLIIVVLIFLTIFDEYRKNLTTESITESIFEIIMKNEEVKNLIGSNFTHIKDPYISTPSDESNEYYWHIMFIENSYTQFNIATVLYDNNEILWIEVDPLYNGYEDKESIRLEVNSEKMVKE